MLLFEQQPTLSSCIWKCSVPSEVRLNAPYVLFSGYLLARCLTEPAWMVVDEGNSVSGRIGSHIAIRGVVSELSGPRNTRYARQICHSHPSGLPLPSDWADMATLNENDSRARFRFLWQTHANPINSLTISIITSPNYGQDYVYVCVCVCECLRVCCSHLVSDIFLVSPLCQPPACLILELMLSNNHHQHNDTNYISNFTVIQNSQLNDVLSVWVLVKASELSGITWE